MSNLATSRHQEPRSVVVDVAGGALGGAGRYLAEFVRWLEQHPRAAAVIGQNRQLTTPWILARERRARSLAAHRVVALNNASFIGGEERVVVVRNALHFMTHDELAKVLPRRGAVEVSMQALVIRGLMRRATEVIVPTASMANRVEARAPWVADRLSVRHHPVSRPVSHVGRRERVVLCPIIDAPYKRLGEHIRRFLASSPRDVELRVTMSVEQLASYGLEPSSRLVALGLLGREAMAREFTSCAAVFMPLHLESFGYAFAEALVNRRPVIATDSDIAREVAREALVAYDSDESLATAIERALSLELGVMDRNPFDPSDYFSRLIGVSPA